MNTGRHAVSPRREFPGWLAFLAAGCLTALAGEVLSRAGYPWIPGVIQVAGIVAAIVGVVRYRPVTEYIWWIMIAGGTGWIVADALTRGDPVEGELLRPGPAASLLLGSYAVVALGLALLTRRPGARPTTMVDALVIGAALVVLAWTFVVRSAMSATWPPRIETIMTLGHAAAAAVLIVAVLRLVMLENEPTAATPLLCLAALALVVADVSRTAPVSGAIGLADLGGLLGQVWAVGLGAAALDPGTLRLRPSQPQRRSAVSRRRLAAFVLLALLSPMAPLGAAMIAQRDGQPAHPGTYLPPALAAIAVSVLLVVRLGMVARVADGQAADLRRSLRQRAALERELRHRATHDPLTGLANRALLLQRLGHALTAPRGQAGSLVLIDLDGFKDVNDTLGHRLGDEILVQVADRLRAALPAADLIARLGGDEFALLCRPRSDGGAQARQALDSLRPVYRAGDAEVYLTASAGLLDLAGAATSAEALRDADLALTAAKDIGKNQLVAFQPELLAEWVQRNELAAGLRQALVDDRFFVHYQPVVDLGNGRMVAVEALLRWTGDGGETIPPMHFIPVAEETGLIVPIGEWVLRRACAAAKPWYDGYGVAVTVNVSGYQLREPGFVDVVLGVLAETGLPSGALILELTETTMITDPEATRALEQLRSQGVRVAIDDFGTGYSSLSYLVQLPVDIIKIDRAFMAPRPAAYHWAFVRAILDIANSLHLVTIAEGVETDQQAQTLRTLACPLAQGFRYSRPVDAAAIAELLAAWNSRREAPKRGVPARTTPALATAVLDKRALDRKALDKKALDKKALDATVLDKRALDTASLDTASLDTASLDTASLDAASLDTTSLDTTAELPIVPSVVFGGGNGATARDAAALIAK